jgi:hypothetical protein
MAQRSVGQSGFDQKAARGCRPTRSGIRKLGKHCRVGRHPMPTPYPADDSSPTRPLRPLKSCSGNSPCAHLKPGIPRIGHRGATKQTPPAGLPVGLPGGVRRVLRGGSFNNDPHNLRCAYRNDNHPANRNNNIGLRLCCVASHTSSFSLRRGTTGRAGASTERQGRASKTPADHGLRAAARERKWRR